jgi:hypothetical protein
MKTAGMFLELGRVRQPTLQHSIRDSVAATPLPDVDRVAAYLRSGHVLIDFMDVKDDVLDHSRQVMGGPTILTDGEWLWRDDLAYYVSRHNVLPPEEFLQLIRKRHYIVPDVDEATLEKITEFAHHLMF